MKDTAKTELEEKISARLKSLTPTNDDLLKTLNELEYKGCSDFTGSSDLEEWDPSYFPRASNRLAQYERAGCLDRFICDDTTRG